MNPDVAEHSPSILIVDNELRNRELLRIMLAGEGFQIQSAASAEEGLAMIAQHAPDLILLDVMMAGMDGYQMAAKLKGDRATRHIPIIMVTARDDQDGKMLGLLSGAENFLTKPVNRAELCLRARNLIRLKAHGDYHRLRSETLECALAASREELTARIRALEQQSAVALAQPASPASAPHAAIVCDMDDRILHWDHGAELMYGWLSTQAVGRTRAEVLRSEYFEPLERIEATLRHHGRWQGESIQCRRDGRRLSTVSCRTLQRDAGGNPIRILSIDDEISVIAEGASAAGASPDDSVRVAAD
jgi:PAS domain S-box-containing protein